MVRAALFLIYSACAHWSVVRDAPGWEVVSLTALAAGVLYPSLLARRAGSWLGLAAVAAACTALSLIGGGRYALYLPSMALPAAALYGFAQSLRPGRTALVSAIAESVHGPLPPWLAAYTRGVTWMWTLFTAAVLIVDIGLIAAAPRRVWSEFANFYIYGIVAAAFLGEYAYRRVRFRHFDQPRFVDYLRLVARSRPGLA